MRNRLAAIVPYFNPYGYQRVVEKYGRFRDAFHGCDLFAIETGFGGRFDTGAEFRFVSNEQQVLWQKERMVRLATSWLPDRYDRVAWIDADVLAEHDSLDTAPYAPGFAWAAHRDVSNARGSPSSTSSRVGTTNG